MSPLCVRERERKLPLTLWFLSNLCAWDRCLRHAGLPADAGGHSAHTCTVAGASVRVIGQSRGCSLQSKRNMPSDERQHWNRSQETPRRRSRQRATPQWPQFDCRSAFNHADRTMILSHICRLSPHLARPFFAILSRATLNLVRNEDVSSPMVPSNDGPVEGFPASPSCVLLPLVEESFWPEIVARAGEEAKEAIDLFAYLEWRQNSSSSSNGRQRQAGLEEQRVAWSSSERKVMGAAEDYLESADTKVDIEARYILEYSTRRGSNIFQLFDTKEKKDHFVASRRRWLERQGEKETLQESWPNETSSIKE